MPLGYDSIRVMDMPAHRKLLASLSVFLFQGGTSLQLGLDEAQNVKLDEVQNTRRDERPNILFLMTDSMDGRMVDPESPESKAVDMPFLRDFLGKKGANFVQGYSNNPMCVPSRTSMMTGRSSYQLGVWGNRDGLAASPGGVLDEDCVTNNGKERCEKWAKQQGNPEHVFSMFKKLGYRVHVDGRTHLGAAMLNEADNDDKVEGLQSCRAFDTTRLGEVLRAADIRQSPGESYRKAYLKDASLDGGDPQFFQADWLVVERCKNFINYLPAPGQAKQPFFLHCSLNIPHYTFSTNSTWLARVHDSEIVFPKWLKGFPESYHPYDSYMTIATGMDQEVSKEDIMKLQRVYYGMVAESDAMLQGIWDALVAKGYGLDNTYVVYVSDHGEMRFQHRQIYKASMYEGSVRVPIQVAGPGITGGQRLDHHVTSLLDVFPTLLDMAQETNANSYKNLMGRSLLSAVGGASVAPSSMRLAADKDDRDLVISHYNWVEGPTGAFMVRSGNWKLITYGHTFKAFKNYQPQLFDLKADPDEMHDLSKSRRDVVDALDKRMREVLDPDVADRWVAESDWARLKERYPGIDDPSKGAVRLRSDAKPKFSQWVNEAKALFDS